MRLRSKAAVLAACCAVVALVAGCTADSTTPSAASTRDPASTKITPVAGKATPVLPVSVPDGEGMTATVTDVSRIVVISPGIGETVFTLGLGANVVGRDIATTFDGTDDIPIVTRAHDIAVEGVLSLRPTVIIGDTTAGPPEAIAQLRKAGIPVVLTEQTWSLADVAPRIREVAAALGVKPQGEKLVKRTDKEIAAASAPAATRAQKVKVAFLYVRGTAAVYLIGGKGSGADSMIQGIGAIDAGTEAGLDSFTPITSEAVIKAQPDVILVMTKGLESVGGVDGLVKLPGVAQTPAGKNKRIVAIDDGLLLNFGPRTGLALEHLSDEVYG